MASTIKVTDIAYPGSANTAITINSNDSVSIVGGNLSPYTGMRNRIINGGMTIDQRNAGASVALNVAGLYFLDRWSVRNQGLVVGNGVLTAQQSSVTPSGFSKSLSLTVTTADASIAANEAYIFSQLIEGFNVSDLSFGTANASSITLSLWARSSITGNFSGSIGNTNNTRSYVFTYNISAANTWEYKTITIPGDTTGTWSTDSGIGMRLNFDMGSGTDLNGTADAWQSSISTRTASSVNFIATSGATFYITGVQLEKGSTATPFEFRSIGAELALCQRYYYKTTLAATQEDFGNGFVSTTTAARLNVTFPVSMRTSPTALEQNGTAGDYRVRHQSTATTCSVVPSFTSATTINSSVAFTVASGLTVGQGCMFGTPTTNNAFLAWSAEL